MGLHIPNSNTLVFDGIRGLPAFSNKKLQSHVDEFHSEELTLAGEKSEVHDELVT